MTLDILLLLDAEWGALLMWLVVGGMDAIVVLRGV